MANSFFVPQWTDQLGGLSKPYSFTAAQTPAVLTPFVSLLSALDALSACKLGAVVLQLYAPNTSSFGSSSTPNCTDEARIQLKSSGGKSGYIVVPGPIDGIWTGPGGTLDIAASQVVALQSALTVLGPGDGTGWTTIVGGVRGVVAPGPGVRRY